MNEHIFSATLQLLTPENFDWTRIILDSLYSLHSLNFGSVCLVDLFRWMNCVSYIKIDRQSFSTVCSTVEYVHVRKMSLLMFESAPMFENGWKKKCRFGAKYASEIVKVSTKWNEIVRQTQVVRTVYKSSYGLCVVISCEIFCLNDLMAQISLNTFTKNVWK